MKKNKLKTGELLVYNIALKRDDGKIERDTVFRDKYFTEAECRQIAEKYTCEVLVEFTGVYRPVKDALSLEHSFFVKLPDPVEVDDGNK